jgi:hypothetical protein
MNQINWTGRFQLKLHKKSGNHLILMEFIHNVESDVLNPNINFKTSKKYFFCIFRFFILKWIKLAQWNIFN